MARSTSLPRLARFGRTQSAKATTLAHSGVVAAVEIDKPANSPNVGSDYLLSGWSGGSNLTPLVGRVRSWAIWDQPDTVRRYVLTVFTVAAATSVATAFLVPVTQADVGRFGILAACAVVSIECTRRIEREREYLRSRRIAYVDTKGIWSGAAVLVLPPVLATAMVVLTYGVAWFRVWPSSRPAPHRWLFGAATVLIGTQAAATVLAVGLRQYPGLPSGELLAGLSDLGVITLALGARWLFNCGLVMAVIALSSPSMPAGKLFNGFSQQMLEAGSMALALVSAAVLVANPLMLAPVVLAVVVMHRSVLLHQYQVESRTDAKTGLTTSKWWTVGAERAFAAARRTKRPMGLLILDLDHFKRINDNFNHLVGDQVLKAVAQGLLEEVRDQDSCCRWGGEELTVIVPEVNSPSDLKSIGERIRRMVEDIEIYAAGKSGETERVPVTASIGAALYPAEGLDSLDDLIRTADMAVYQAKEGGRNRVVLAGIEAPDGMAPSSEAATK